MRNKFYGFTDVAGRTCVVIKTNSLTDRAGAKVIDAFVPLAEMFGYSTTLRSMTQGRASYSMEFDHYAETPQNIQAAIVEGRTKKPAK